MIRQKFPRDQKRRIDMQLVNGQLDYAKQEWQSGEFHPGSPDVDSQVRFHTTSGGFKLFRKVNFPKRLGWTENTVITAAEFRKAAEPIIEDIEAWAKVRLPNGRHGCPFIGLEDWMPEEWGWISCHQFFRKRLWRMTSRCNRRHPTIDTVVTIFIECILQVVIRIMDCGSDDIKKGLQIKYMEFLCLPIDVADRKSVV